MEHHQQIYYTPSSVEPVPCLLAKGCYIQMPYFPQQKHTSCQLCYPAHEACTKRITAPCGTAITMLEYFSFTHILNVQTVTRRQTVGLQQKKDTDRCYVTYPQFSLHPVGEEAGGGSPKGSAFRDPLLHDQGTDSVHQVTKQGVASTC